MSTVLPTLKTKKIKILKSKETAADLDFFVHFCLGPSSKSIKSYFQNSLSSIFVYFFVFEEDEFPEANYALSGNLRMQFIRSLMTGGRNKQQEKQKNSIRISLLDIMKSSDTYPTSQQDQGTHELHFKINIPYFLGALTNKNDKDRTLHLVSFLEGSENNRESITDNDFTYDLLCMVNRNTGEFTIPKKRKVFVVNEPSNRQYHGRAWSGPTHYYDRSSPGPNGKVGWCTGEIPGTRSRLKLKVMTLEDYKVQSPTIAERAFICKENIPTMISTVQSDVGSDLEKVTDSASPSLGAGTRQQSAKLISNSIFAGHKKATFITKETAESSYFRAFSKGKGEDSLDTSYCGSIIGINSFLLTQSQSCLGRILSFHNSHNNKDFVQSMVNMSKILALTVSRKRVEREYYTNNKQISKVRVDYNKSESPLRIIESRENDRGQIIGVTNARASLEQINLVDIDTKTSNKYVRSLNLKDYELFHNFDFGVYTYDLEIVADDGPLKFVNRLYNKIHTVENKYLQYMEEAQKLENYNYILESPKVHFSKTSQFENIISETLKTYSVACRFLSGSAPNLTVLERHIRPTNIDLSVAEGFLSAIQKVKKKIENILKSISRAVTEEKGKGLNFQVSPETSSRGLKNVMFAKAKTNIFHDVESLLEVMIDNCPPIVSSREHPSLLELATNINFYKQESANKDEKYSGRVELTPSRFVEVEKSKYFIKNDNIRTLGSAAINARTRNHELSTHYGVSKEDLPKGSLKTIISKRAYDALSQSEKNNFDTMFGAMRSAELDGKALRDKPPEFFPRFLQTNLSGMTISASGFSTTRPRDDQEEIFQGSLKKIIPNVDSGVQKAIINSVYTVEDREEFEKNIENNFKELISIKKTLGNFYTVFSQFIGFKKSSIMQEAKKVNYKDIYNNSKNYHKEQQLFEDSFQSEHHTMCSLTPMYGKKYITRQILNTRNMTQTLPEGRYAFIKFETYEEKSTPAINNGVLIRV